MGPVAALRRCLASPVFGGNARPQRPGTAPALAADRLEAIRRAELARMRYHSLPSRDEGIRMRTKLVLLALSAALGAVALPRSVRADAIDGDWCSEDGRRISVQGAAVVT